MQDVMNTGRGDENWIEVPKGYRTGKIWSPQIGDIFPNFSAMSTKGEMAFHNWAEGRWIYLFSHPAAFTPICTTELASLAEMQPDFERAGVAVVGLSVGMPDDTARWVEDVERIFGLKIVFPVVSDPDGRLSRAMGLIHPKNDKDCTIRKSFIIDPALRVRMMLDYPAFVGRSSEEVLRAIEALQMADRTGLAVPADWQPGDDLLARPGENDDADLDARYGEGWTRLSRYLKVVHTDAAERSCD